MANIHGEGPEEAGEHTHADLTLREASKRSLMGALSVTLAYVVLGLIVGLLSGSLLVIAHAGHMLANCASLGLALLAIRLAEQPASAHRTYGYNRAEILAAGFNALSMWLIAAFILREAISRFGDEQELGGNDHHVEGVAVLSVEVLGILVLLAAAYIMSRSSKRSLNVEGARRHLMADVVSSSALVVSGFLVIVFGEAKWVEVVDPALSIFIALLIVGSSWRLTTSVFTVLIEGTPEHLDLYKLCHDIEEVPGVTVIHDIHVWTVTSGYVSLTAHVLVDPEHQGDSADMLREMRRIATEQHGIAHTTIQLETSVADCTEDHHVDHLLLREQSRRRRTFGFGRSHQVQ